ncbi:WD40-repeat-containing domain protein [Coniochaeta sp. 2T2.1]|nr:WD40-repeat-containing domain protein [Coniochaeta sp. 2T2.1]
MTSPSTRPVFTNTNWGPSREGLISDTKESTARTGLLADQSTAKSASGTRSRSMSLSFPWRQRRKSSLFGFEEGVASDFAELSLEKDGHMNHSGIRATEGSAVGESSQRGGLKGIVRRASVSVKTGVKGLVHRRTSVPAFLPHDDQTHAHDMPFRQRFGSVSHSNQRPTTSHSTWHRLRQAASFHRHSRLLHTGYDDRAFGLEPIESPTLPIPGSGVQPPIIPRNTGAAARQAAAEAHNEFYGVGNLSDSLPKPNWLAPEEALHDYESGIGIALTSSEVEIYVPSDDVDSDVDVDADGAEDASDISKVDFITCLPAELAIQILAYLDAATLATASRVSKEWCEAAANQHIWRESFLREKTTTYATSGPVKPGTGLGVPSIQPNNDWKQIYRVKEELDKRWKEGKARPVYLNGHSDSIYCLQFDESKIITGSRDKTVRVWDMATFACKLVIGPPEKINDPCHSVLYDEDGNPTHYATLPESDASPPFNHTQPIPTPRAHESMPALVSFPIHHNASILCLQYDDRILVTGSSDSTCIVYNIKSGYRPVRRLRHHSAAVLDLVFDDKHIVTCSKDISICVWDRETGALLKQLRGHSGPVNAVQMRGNTIVSCSGDFRVKLWNIDTGKNIREFSGHTKGLACSQFSEDGRYVASAGNDKVIRIWDANTGECVREMRAHDNLVRSLHVDSVSGRLVSGSYDTDIKVFDMETGRQLLDFPRWHNSWVLSAKSDYRRIVSTGQDPKILIMDFGAGIEGVEMLESKRVVGVEGGYI